MEVLEDGNCLLKSKDLSVCPRNLFTSFCTSPICWTQVRNLMWLTMPFIPLSGSMSYNRFPDPTCNSYITCLQDAAKCVATPKVNRKDPVSPDMCDLNVDSTDVLVVRDLTMILLSFAVFYVMTN